MGLMALNFAELSKKVRSGTRLDLADMTDIVTASPGATFALAELAAEFRRAHFRKSMEVVNLIDEGEEPTNPTLPGQVLEVGAGKSPEEVAEQLAQLAASEGHRMTLRFVQGDSPALTPMYCLRLLAALRLAAPEKSLRVAEGRVEYLRSLQPLALQIIDSMHLSDYRLVDPRLVFEDLKLLQDGGLQVAAAEGRNLAQEYADYLQEGGVADAQLLAQLIVSAGDSLLTGGCGGNCACGAGGCGS